MIDATSRNCRLSIYKSDFELNINEEGNIVRSCQSAGFQLLMKQAKANYGIRSGRFMFEIKIIRYLDPEEFKGFNALAKNQIINDSLKESKHLVRVGWSTQYAKTSTALGVDYDSCGYENSGTRYYAGNYKKYGETFGPGDVIRCCIDLEGQNKSFSFYKNGQFQGIAYRISNKQNDKAYFPSVNIRNAEIMFNFGNNQDELFPIKPEGALSITVIQPGAVMPIHQNPAQVQQPLVTYPGQPQAQTSNPYIAPTVAPQTNLPAGQYIVPQTTAQNQYVNHHAQQPIPATGAPVAQQNPYAYGQQAAYQQQPYVHQQYPQQPYIQQQPYQQQESAKVSIPNAQNLVSKEEIKISQYSFIHLASDSQKEYEQIQILEQYEAIFMVGLPASGKTTFAQQYVKKNQDTILLGSFEIFEHIVNNIQVQHLNQNLTLLMEICNHIMEKSMKLIARLQKRSVLIDQCNVLLKARLKKLKIFKNFVRKAFVLVVSDSDQRKRMLKRERQILNQCQMYPKLCLESFRNLQENFVMPTKEEGFAEIQYLEIEEDIAQRVALMNNLIVVNEVHPLLKPYDFKRVKALKEAQEKLKMQQLQQPQQRGMPVVQQQQQQQLQAPQQQQQQQQQYQQQQQQQAGSTGNNQQTQQSEIGQNKSQSNQIQFITQNNAEQQQPNQNESENKQDQEHDQQDEEMNNSQEEYQNNQQENYENENSQDQDGYDQEQEYSNQYQENSGQNNSNHDENENQGQEQDQQNEDEMVEEQQNE
ncbi:SPRY domain protein (macronuclear) [Tetrahymena thermophila SB210]|uniref:SPRY domain protein n=1 Tax=Tetrahymena thermophila (strain SB210) TaxID=312017 RepID=Q239D5_TETTS|nr:SPRY domain protein [Tetrahymena thermophila SB210]EAR93035.2 SPRY domain protein [Tetrahymena thermophila SB210]|eukprot:XP_001013280.2 SPRY domain protein [Tetrahymena thermophila SB210]